MDFPIQLHLGSPFSSLPRHQHSMLLEGPTSDRQLAWPACFTGGVNVLAQQILIKQFTGHQSKSEQNCICGVSA